MTGRVWLITGAVLGGTGVALGAFGAHALRSALPDLAPTVEEQQRLLDVWETAVRYQMYHALAIIVAGLLMRSSRTRLLPAAGCCFLFGVAIFSGLLYALVLTGVKLLGAIVPIGGTALIIGWLLLAIAAAKHERSDHAKNRATGS